MICDVALENLAIKRAIGSDDGCVAGVLRDLILLHRCSVNL